MNPMLASAMPEGVSLSQFMSAEWCLEEKFDGHRVTVLKQGDTVSAWSRPQRGATKAALPRTLPPAIVDALRDLPDGRYDGELVVPGKRSWHVARNDSKHQQQLVLFDMLEVLGTLVIDRPYAERRALLTLAVAHHGGDRLRVPESVPVSAEAAQAIWDRGGEGAIVKRLAARYQPGKRSPDWVKVKRKAAATLTIIGFHAGKSGPHGKMRLRDDHGVETSCGTPRDVDPQRDLGRRVVISYTEKTDSGSYRHGSFDHFAEGAVECS
jgi:bifunctional non-homologous end joining protein LigD